MARASNHGTTAANGGTRNLNDPGAVGVLALGWGYGNGWRAEIEGSLRGNEVSELRTLRGNGQLVNTGNPTGRAGTAALMLNVLYDLDLARWGIPVRPYLGGGIGYGWRQYYDVTGQEPIGVRGPNGLVTGPGQVRLRGTYGDLAYQAIAGLALPIRAVPGLELTAEYRFFAMDGTKFQESRTLFFPNPSGGGQQSPQFSRRDDNHNHSALLGLRYAFNAPRPAPVVAVAPAPQRQEVARTYLVFFDWDRADLTDRARQIIGEAATNSRSSRATRIEVSGHADRSGTPAYNQRLSQRRADAVAAELVSARA